MLRKKVFFFSFVMCFVFVQKTYAVNKDSLIHAVLQSINADSISRTINDLQNFNNRFALMPHQKDIATYLSEKFTVMGYSNVKLDSFLLDSIEWPQGGGDYYTQWQYNVIAQTDGQTDVEKIYIMGAHYDAIIHQGDAFGFTPGADDNASGVAAMIETARVFKLHNIQPAYTLRFVAFAAEELNLRGSNDYAGRVGNAGEHIALMINNDMIAHNLQAPNNLKFKIQKYPNTDWVEALTQHIADTYTNLSVIIDSNHIMYSDSYLFHLWGYPAVFYQEYDFFTSLHTVSDIADSLDMAYCAEVTKISCGVLLNTNIVETSIQNLQQKDYNVQIFPVPAKDIVKINIELVHEKEVLFEIYDNSMSLKWKSKHVLHKGQNTVDINMDGFAQGLYHCKISDNQNMKIYKIIKL